MKRRVMVILFLVFRFSAWQAQERLGITNSNYYSTASIHLNPSSSVDCRTYMQLHLVGMNAFVKTNFAYLPNFSIGQVINAPDLVRTQGNNKKFLYLNASLEGPAFVFSKRTYGVGFFTRLRTVTDMRRVSYDLAAALLNGEGSVSSDGRNLMGQNFKNAKMSQMSWAEYGINFGKMLVRSRDRLITVGGNLKYLTGISVLYTNIKEFKSYYNDNGTFGISSLQSKFLWNKPQWGSGRGFGLDLGITFKQMEDYVEKYYANSRLSNCKYVDYKYKIGVSLRDAGYIRYQGATTDTRVSGSGYFDPSRTDTSFATAVQYNFSSTTKTGKPIVASLPTALSGQFDYNFDNSVYLNITLVKNLVPTRITGVQSPDLLSVCPRVEFRQFEFALPLTFHRFIYPQLGAGLRYRSFVIGMDNIIPLFMKSNTYGLNLYASLAVSIFSNPACKTKRSGVSDCPSYRKAGKNRPKRRKSFSS